MAGVPEWWGSRHSERMGTPRAAPHRASPTVRSARQRRWTTDQRLAQLGFASLRAHLVDRTTQRAWTLAQIASEMGIHRDTVRDRLNRHGLRPTRPTAH
jgi:transcriptional regulator of acetoin/glycerol metabolism